MDRQATFLLALGLLITAAAFVSAAGWILFVRDRRADRATAAAPATHAHHEVHEALLAEGFDDAAQYAVAMAYKIRFVMQMNAREAMHLIELRSTPQGHPVYRRVAQQMHRLIDERAGHHALAAAMRYVDYSNVELERLEAERRTEAKRKARR